ncbi:30S ribosomal protein S20 [Planctomycetales bacterium ZRK34]|nr:30S ribosomal protein S20 [Planctomycetales bacterium ZRK34]
MAHSRSAKKRIRQNENRRAINRWRKSRIKEQVKTFLDDVQHGDAAKAQASFKAAARTLDKIAASGTIHKNTAARRKSRLAKRLNALAAKA